jgi:hypothetical protein
MLADEHLDVLPLGLKVREVRHIIYNREESAGYTHLFLCSSALGGRG